MATISAFPINTVLPTANVVTNTPHGFLTATNVQASLQQVVDKVAALGDPGSFVYLTDFGVASDGFTDDTAALNAAFASVAGQTATVIWPPGFCKTTDTVTVGVTDINGGQSHINIIGNGSDATSGIWYFGPTDRPAIVVSRMTNFSFSNLFILNGVARGTTVGILFGGRNNPADFGNLTNNFQLYGCNVSGFATGVMAGGHWGAASEGSFYSCGFSNNGKAFDANDFNSLDFVFIMLGLSENTIGIDSGVSGGYHVYGGSGSFNGSDFVVGGNANCSINGFRSEVAGNFVTGANARKCTITNCSTVSPPSPFVAVGGSFSHLVVRDCGFGGSISPTPHIGFAEITGCNFDVWDVANKLPMFLPQTDGNLVTEGYFRNNTDTGVFPPRQILDQQGLFGLKQQDFPAPPTVLYEPCITVVPVDHASTTDLGCNYLSLNHVRSLSEGSAIGSSAGTTPTSGKNLRVRGTFAGSATLAFTFVRTNVIVSTNATDMITATTGTFNQSDVGKKLKIVLGTDTGIDWYGYIHEYLSPTTVNIMGSSFAPASGRYPQGVGKATVIGENEPDANYMVAGLCPNANETFWVDNITSTGFTLHSSNPTSTATVTALIVR